jgi:hypothetical protein
MFVQLLALQAALRRRLCQQTLIGNVDAAVDTCSDVNVAMVLLVH